MLDKHFERFLTGPPQATSLYPYLEIFRKDYPNWARTALIMMDFGENNRHQKIFNATRVALSNLDIHAVRADEIAYSDEINTNVRVYMEGCGLGVAIFERFQTDVHNANVTWEHGYMTALNKDVCILKDSELIELPVNLRGRQFYEFDLDNPLTSIETALKKWISSKKNFSPRTT